MHITTAVIRGDHICGSGAKMKTWITVASMLTLCAIAALAPIAQCQAQRLLGH